MYSVLFFIVNYSNNENTLTMKKNVTTNSIINDHQVTTTYLPTQSQLNDSSDKHKEQGVHL